MTTASPTPNREITTRRIDFPFPEDLPRHFMGGDLVKSHLIAMLSSVFPDGEDFFVRTVRHYRDRIEDPELKRQVGRFIGQEAVHGREHRDFNDHLQSLGYPTDAGARMADRLLNRWATRFLPPAGQLAVTAALEHYTATLAELLLDNPAARADFSEESARNLFLWHAVEESEHKAVAFDVFMAVCGDEKVRVRTMKAVNVLFLGAMVVLLTRSLLKDPASRDLRRLGRSLKRFRADPLLGRWARERLADYNRAGFHPDDQDTDALLDHWRHELFGPQGAVTTMTAA